MYFVATRLLKFVNYVYKINVNRSIVGCCSQIVSMADKENDKMHSETADSARVLRLLTQNNKSDFIPSASLHEYEKSKFVET